MTKYTFEMFEDWMRAKYFTEDKGFWKCIGCLSTLRADAMHPELTIRLLALSLDVEELCSYWSRKFRCGAQVWPVGAAEITVHRRPFSLLPPQVCVEPTIFIESCLQPNAVIESVRWRY